MIWEKLKPQDEATAAVDIFVAHMQLYTYATANRLIIRFYGDCQCNKCQVTSPPGRLAVEFNCYISPQALLSCS
ncbi:unnamed protein product [Ceratitis capitata]|uniref:(Mediterranean fruit fly) hypothetical protein n=1 Tax=Ceratitis capitata TaxID=7213 RepID=A0A811TXP1_CERCA|nr:unnamed protein product [Ceratitis capitata]